VNILSLNTERYPDLSLSKRLKSSILIKECPMCAAETSFTKETKVLTCGSVVIFHLERFSYSDNIAIRNPCIVDCSDDLILPISPSLDNSICISFRNKYSLVAIINHSGTLSSGHYTAFVKDPLSNSWYHCNDKLVTQCAKENVVNNSSYLLFYRIL